MVLHTDTLSLPLPYEGRYIYIQSSEILENIWDTATPDKDDNYYYLCDPTPKVLGSTTLLYDLQVLNEIYSSIDTGSIIIAIPKCNSLGQIKEMLQYVFTLPPHPF